MFLEINVDLLGIVCGGMFADQFLAFCGVQTNHKDTHHTNLMFMKKGNFTMIVVIGEVSGVKNYCLHIERQPE